MKKFNYSLAKGRLVLLTILVDLIIRLPRCVEAIQELISMTSSYSSRLSFGAQLS